MKKVDPPSSQGPSLSPQNGVVISLLALLLATLAVYNPVGHFPFTNFDDDRYITGNAHVRAGLHWAGIKWAFTTFAFNWHPVTWLSHMLDCQLFATNAGGHHYTSLLLHIVNVLLLFVVLKRATGYAWRSLAVAALFALHPINVESVVWIAERKNVLSMLFFLLALGAYQWYTHRPGVRRYAVVALLFALGLMAKAQVITFPCVLLLWDYWPLRRLNFSAAEREGRKSLGWLALEKTPLLALAAAGALLTIKAQHAVDAIASTVRYPLSTRVENAVVSYARYIGKALWPAHLAPMYPLPEAVKLWHFGAALLLLAGITAVVLAGKRRYLTVGWFWFLGTLVPMIGLVQIGSQAMADRYAYLSFLGLFIMVCWGLGDWAQSRRVTASWVGGLSLAALLALTFLTHYQIGYWRDNTVLWTHALQVSADNFVAEDGLGGALLAKGELEQAAVHYRRAAALHPSDPISNLNIGLYDQQHNDLRGAIAEYQKVTQITQDSTLRGMAFSNLGFIYRQLGDLPQARQAFESALQLRPRELRAMLGLGLVAQQLGQPDLAARAYSDAIAIQPDDVFYLLLSRALQQGGHAQEAQAALEHSRRVSQDFAKTQAIVEKLTHPE
jgi:Flp pilus assembly protein TadD